jgi:hypothetical protein
MLSISKNEIFSNFEPFCFIIKKFQYYEIPFTIPWLAKSLTLKDIGTGALRQQNKITNKTKGAETLWKLSLKEKIKKQIRNKR